MVPLTNGLGEDVDNNQNFGSRDDNQHKSWVNENEHESHLEICMI